MSTPNPRKKIRIGDLLVDNRVITEDQLSNALREQRKTGRKLGRMLIELGYISEDQMLEFLSQQLKLPVVDLKHYQFNADLVRKLPEIHARRFRAIVLDDSERETLVGMADPTDIFAYDELIRLLGGPLRLAVVRESELLRSFDLFYRKTHEISSLAEELGQEMSEGEFDLAQLLQTNDVVDAPVVKLLQSLFEDAVAVGASDIHIEPDDQLLRIRQRVDGLLDETVMKDNNISSALVSRLKLMSGLDISERRMPQDGRFNIKVRGHNIDVRLSTMPVQYGESVVMRLLDQSTGILHLDQLGMPPELVTRFRRAIRYPHGMVLVTGPTGSGKTTTLYAALSELNSPEKKIITVEDPVEYRLPRINQVQVNSKINLSFSSVLRSALRQDPDIVLVGEMRDQETVEIGLRAAMTGHLVLSTLHTNDAITSANRLLDMGAKGYLVAASLHAILAQRLIRRICENCASPDTLEPGARVWVDGILGAEARHAEFRIGKGCPHCNNTGYRGRLGVFEMLEMDEQMADALRTGDSVAFHHAARKSAQFKPLVLSALDMALQGITTVDEVLRVAGEQIGPIVEDDPYLSEIIEGS